MNDDLHLVPLVPVQLGSNRPSVQLMKLFHSDHDLCRYWYLSWTLAATPWLPNNGLSQVFNLVPFLFDHSHLYDVAFFLILKRMSYNLFIRLTFIVRVEWLSFWIFFIICPLWHSSVECLTLIGQNIMMWFSVWKKNLWFWKESLMSALCNSPR